MNSEFYTSIFVLILILLFIFFYFGSHPSKVKELNELANKSITEIKENDEIFEEYNIKLGNFRGQQAVLYIGNNALYVLNLQTGSYNPIFYHEILAVSSGSPDSMYAMNLNIEGVMANAMTRAEIGQCVFLELDLDYRSMTLIFAGLTSQIAAAIEDKILHRKYLSDIS